MKSDELKVLKDASAAAFAGRPTRPDGKGFVVTKWGHLGKRGPLGPTGISFVDWEGKERPIDGKNVAY
jgi:hypothetical protein